MNQFTEQTNDLLLLKHFYELYDTCQRAYTDKGTKNIKAKKTAFITAIRKIRITPY